MAQQLVVLAADAAREDLHARLGTLGGRVLAAYGPRVWIVDVPGEDESAGEAAGPAGSLDEWPGVEAVYVGPVSADGAVDDETGRLGMAAWNVRHSASFAATRENRVGDGRSWGDEGVEPEG